MIELLIAVSVIVLLTGASVWAERRFHLERVPMQWSFQGRVNWTAPRRLALAFTPTLGALVLGSTAIMALVAGPPRHGEDVGVPVLCIVGFAFLGAHGLHLWLIERSVR